MSKKKKNQIINFTVYTLEPLSQSLRSTWRLPKYPFEINPLGPAPEETQKFFQSIGLIFYRDERNQYGLIVESTGEDKTPIRERAGFEAFRSAGIMDMNLKIIQWRPDRDPLKYRKIVERWGDDYAWQMWNKEVTIYKIDETCVNTA